MTIECLSSNKVFGGWHKQYSHQSSTVNCTMRFAIFLPPQAASNNKVPVLYWLSGLTCTDENVMQNLGFSVLQQSWELQLLLPILALVEKV